VVIFDVQRRLHAIDDAIHHDGADLNRIAVLVDHRRHRNVQGRVSGGHTAQLATNRVHPLHSPLADRSNVFSELEDHDLLTRVHDVEPPEQDEGKNERCEKHEKQFHEGSLLIESVVAAAPPNARPVQRLSAARSSVTKNGCR
jgi:hypothetical protein